MLYRLAGLLFTFVIAWSELLIALVFDGEEYHSSCRCFELQRARRGSARGVINASAMPLCVPRLIFVVMLMNFLNRFFKAEGIL